MTHDELLAKIYDSTNGLKYEDIFILLIENTNALRAAVELHKPIEEDGKLYCSQELCYNHIEFLERDKCDCSYPCPTIRAIEKELN